MSARARLLCLLSWEEGIGGGYLLMTLYLTYIHIFSVLILLPDSCMYVVEERGGVYTRSTMYFPLDVFCVSVRECAWKAQNPSTHTLCPPLSLTLGGQEAEQE